jgi:hypothetical protein
MGRTLGATALLVLGLMSSMAQAQRDRPLPLDPLTPRERALTDSIIRSDAKVREFLGSGRSRLINVDFIAVKDGNSLSGRDELPTRRTSNALLYRYDTNQGIRVLVDIAGRRVIDIARIPGASVPINTDEVTEAARLALADRRVVALFGYRMPPFSVARRPETRADVDKPRIEGLQVSAPNDKDPCYQRRCVGLLFRVNNRYVHTGRVFVDLMSERVFVREGVR